MDAMLNTAAILAKNGIRSTGAGLDYDDAHLPVLTIINSSRIAISALYKYRVCRRTRPAHPRVSRWRPRTLSGRISSACGITTTSSLFFTGETNIRIIRTQGQIDLAHAVIDGGPTPLLATIRTCIRAWKFIVKTDFLFPRQFLFGSTNENGETTSSQLYGLKADVLLH